MLFLSHFQLSSKGFQVRCSLSILLRLNEVFISLILFFSEIIAAFSGFISLIFLFNEMITIPSKWDKTAVKTKRACALIHPIDIDASQWPIPFLYRAG